MSTRPTFLGRFTFDTSPNNSTRSVCLSSGRRWKKACSVCAYPFSSSNTATPWGASVRLSIFENGEQAHRSMRLWGIISTTSARARYRTLMYGKAQFQALKCRYSCRKDLVEPISSTYWRVQRSFLAPPARRGCWTMADSIGEKRTEIVCSCFPFTPRLVSGLGLKTWRPATSRSPFVVVALSARPAADRMLSRLSAELSSSAVKKRKNLGQHRPVLFSWQPQRSVEPCWPLNSSRAGDSSSRELDLLFEVTYAEQKWQCG